MIRKMNKLSPSKQCKDKWWYPLGTKRKSIQREFYNPLIENSKPQFKTAKIAKNEKEINLFIFFVKSINK